MESIIAQVAPSLIDVAAAIIGFAVTWGIKKLSDLVNVNIEANKQAALSDAFQRATRQALTRIAKGGDVSEAVIGSAKAEIVSYIKSTMPSTLKSLGATDQGLERRAVAEIYRIAGK